ncbi:MAG TPA: MarR family transcriptional regulator [Syntrophomonadaceae bacterium]|nr:MarR family transcriptional regulator [Syntrophomonadaceae bacterium]HQD91489.1 MarR family transcriptional regulator [Syntrophomonadaceae bacterium]
MEFTKYYCFRLGALTRRIINYYNTRFKDLGITLSQSFVLLSLLEQDGSSVKTIASALQLDSPAVTGLVDRLAKQGLVSRQEDPNDRRSTLVFLTQEGQKIAEEAAIRAKEIDPLLKLYLAEMTLVGMEQTMEDLEQKLETGETIGIMQNRKN